MSETTPTSPQSGEEPPAKPARTRAAAAKDTAGATSARARKAPAAKAAKAADPAEQAGPEAAAEQPEQAESTEPQAAPDAAAPEAKAEPDAKPEPEAKAEPDAKPEPEAKAEPDAKPEPAKPAARARSRTSTAKAGAAGRAAAKGGGASITVKADLPADIFDARVSIPLIHQVVVAQQAAARQGTHAVKSRGDVRGGGKKPYRQKGTGRARQGSTRAPQFAGGGVVHGPVPRSYEQRTPKKMKAAALRGALSDRARHGRVHVVSRFTDSDVPKTKDALVALAGVTGAAPAVSPVLVVAESGDLHTWKSLRNVAGVHVIDSGQLNTYDVLVSDHVVFTSEALASFVARAGAARREGEGQ